MHQADMREMCADEAPVLVLKRVLEGRFYRRPAKQQGLQDT